MGDFAEYCRQVQTGLARLHEVSADIGAAVALCREALENRRKIMFCGNGGSAADAQHLAAELMGRFLIDRAPLPALALTVDTSALTAIGNDYGFDEVFARQLRGVGVPGDVLVAISTSGNSRNVLAAISAARAIGIGTVGLTGEAAGAMTELCNVAIRVPASTTNHIQELHIVVGHFICAEIERTLCTPAKP